MPGRSASGRGGETQRRAEVRQRLIRAVVERVRPVRVDGLLVAATVETDRSVPDRREVDARPLQLNLVAAADRTEAKVGAAADRGRREPVAIVAAAEEVDADAVVGDRVR